MREITVPGDKSITQRALILAALADGTSRLSGLLDGADPAALAGVLRALGVEVPPLPSDGSEIVVEGVGLRGLRRPAGPLDCANSGTAARLLLGVLAGQPLTTVVDGDASLRRRPMARVTGPLSHMGASFRHLGEGGRLPVEVRGGELGPSDFGLPVASAQVKSALLLAGLVGGVTVTLLEPGASRDHTERMLRGLGVSVETVPGEGSAVRVTLPEPPRRIPPMRSRVPGDFSSAAFPLVLGVLGGAGPKVLRIRRVGVNPTRTGLLAVLERMGASVELEGQRDEGGEPVADLVVRPAAGPGRPGESGLGGTEVGREEIPALLDEVPALVVAAARAEGETRVTGAEELRVKESDRLALLAEGLRAVGGDAEELEDGIVVRGGTAPLEGTVRTDGDHRIAMAFGVLGALPGNRIRVDDPGCCAVSWPGFWGTLQTLAVGTGGTTGADAPAGAAGRPDAG